MSELWILLAEHHRPLDPLYSLRFGAAGEVRQLLEATLRDPDAAIFVSDGDGDLVGFCSVRVDRSPPIYEESERAEILDLVVRPERRRRGAGLALARAALAWVRARGIERVEVRVVHRNAEGQAFWRRLGFDDALDVLQRRG